LATIDFAGELEDVMGQEGDPVTPEIVGQCRTQIRDWFSGCDAVVLFIDETLSELRITDHQGSVTRTEPPVFQGT
jgi:hypothetical protein